MTQTTSTSTAPEGMSRREFLHLAWAVAGGAAALTTGVLGLSFFAPKIVEGKFGSIFDLGAADSFPVGSVTPITNGRFYLVRQADGGFLALYHKCTHLGCAVPWNPEKGQFICPCHASAFESSGQLINPPAPRPLDRFPITIVEGQIRVDTGTRIERDTVSSSDLVYLEGIQ